MYMCGVSRRLVRSSVCSQTRDVRIEPSDFAEGESRNMAKRRCVVLNTRSHEGASFHPSFNGVRLCRVRFGMPSYDGEGIFDRQPQRTTWTVSAAAPRTPGVQGYVHCWECGPPTPEGNENRGSATVARVMVPFWERNGTTPRPSQIRWPAQAALNGEARGTKELNRLNHGPCCVVL